VDTVYFSRFWYRFVKFACLVNLDISERHRFKFRCLCERLMKFSVLHPTVRSFQRSSHVHVISRSIFAPVVGNAALRKKKDKFTPFIRFMWPCIINVGEFGELTPLSCIACMTTCCSIHKSALTYKKIIFSTFSNQ